MNNNRMRGELDTALAALKLFAQATWRSAARRLMRCCEEPTKQAAR